MRRLTLRRRAGFLLLLGGLATVAWLAPRLCPGPPLVAGFPSSAALFDARGRLLRLAVADDDRFRLWTPLDAISPTLRAAVLAYEDRGFFTHPGVDPVALGRAAAATYLGGGRRVGGSTITMQLARRLHGIRSAGVAGKLAQIGRALWLELRYSKREILEAYLNLVPMGGNLEGVGAASLIYFGKRAGELTPAEAVALALIPQNPQRRGAPERAARVRLERARRRLITSAGGRLGLDRIELAHARVPLRLRSPRELPFEAPHLLDRLAGEGRRGALASTVDLDLQRLVHRQLRAQLERLRPFGVRSAAAMVVDAASLEVRATIGSPDYRDREQHGAIDATRAPRSPGSTLKPFVYGLALEAGLIHPRTLLSDLPMRFGELRAENFDRGFAGPLAAEEALARSRNLPALELAARLPRGALHALLRRAGVRGLRGAEHHGLALALGAVELRMEELCALYAALANGGLHRPLRYLRSDPPGTRTRLLSPEASFVTLEMLREGAGLPATEGARTLRLALKTGTSNGHRDAWAVGVSGGVVIAVWIGDPRGASNPAFVGGSAAAPLLRAIVDALHAERRAPPTASPPPGVRRVEVCATSGRLPGADCPRRRQTWFLPGRSPIATCRVHRRVPVDAATGARVCPGATRLARRLRWELHEHWPSELEAAFRASGLPRRPPPTAALCGGVRGADPEIRSPLSRVTYALAPGLDRIALEASLDGAAAEAFWFIDDLLLGRVARGTTLFWRPRLPGRYRVRVLDSAGRSDVREVEVELASEQVTRR